MHPLPPGNAQLVRMSTKRGEPQLVVLVARAVTPVLWWAMVVLVVWVARRWRRVGMVAPVVMGAVRGCCRCGVQAVLVV